MFLIAILIGIYSYVIFFLGLLGLVYQSHIVLLTTIYILILIYFSRKNFQRILLQYFKVLKKSSQIVKRRLFITFLMILLISQAVVNFIGALGPELGFDALWYHLTLPKIYLMNHSIDYISGGLFHYSTMPKITEMLYIVGLTLGSEIFAKLIHFSFGILCLIAIYKIARKFLSKDFSLLALVLFYSNLVVGWMSITAYVDLARTFFEIMALWGFLEYLEKKKSKWLIVSAVLLGLAISTKLLALGSILIFTVLVIIFTRKITNMLIYWFFALLIPSPWFIFSFVHTGNPFYPFFTTVYPIKFNLNLVNPLNLSDPIFPLYVILLPIALFLYRKFNPIIKLISLYSFLAFFIWYITPQTGGGRFILAYIPAFSIVSIVVINNMQKLEIQKLFIGLVIFFSVFSIAYRSLANSKYIPVIVGKESKSQFLSNNLNFSYGDFYDTDGFFSKKIKSEDKVLLYGFHNLYYINFPFIDSSFVKKGDRFNYIAVQGNNFPQRFKFWNLIYYNNKTDVRLYSTGGVTWIY